ncbi:MAG: hypothetical protein FWB91_05165 [Defluviitaleaceae bacterium]|nr:hypothetical protein [Defluviitaleaceae bacterium]
MHLPNGYACIFCHVCLTRVARGSAWLPYYFFGVFHCFRLVLLKADYLESVLSRVIYKVLYTNFIQVVSCIQAQQMGSKSPIRWDFLQHRQQGIIKLNKASRKIFRKTLDILIVHAHNGNYRDYNKCYYNLIDHKLNCFLGGYYAEQRKQATGNRGGNWRGQKQGFGRYSPNANMEAPFIIFASSHYVHDNDEHI